MKETSLLSVGGEIWKIEIGNSPIVATAIHAGGVVRPEILEHMAVKEDERRREEDPYTDFLTDVVPNRVIVESSRFQVDLNRPREKAVYILPEDAWAIKVWKRDLPKRLIASALTEYDGFYNEMKVLFSNMQARYGRFVVFDLHSYNHRRGGSTAPPDDVEKTPQVNVGTGTMLDRARFAPVIDCFIDSLSKAKYPTGPLDVRENIKFRGGQFAKWTHATFPESACVLSIEVKKFFMDEWTGMVNQFLLSSFRDALALTVSPVITALEMIQN